MRGHSQSDMGGLQGVYFWKKLGPARKPPQELSYARAADFFGHFLAKNAPHRGSKLTPCRGPKMCHFLTPMSRPLRDIREFSTLENSLWVRSDPARSARFFFPERDKKSPPWGRNFRPLPGSNFTPWSECFCRSPRLAWPHAREGFMMDFLSRSGSERCV
jgi:hypothetical protein